MSIGTLVLAVIAFLAAGRATIIMIYLGVAFRTEVNPISAPLSQYVFVDDAGDLYTSAAVALAVGALAVLFGMARAGVRLAGRPTVLFTVWAVCLMLAAAFPTDREASIETFGGWVHQFAGAGIFAFLSFAGLAAASRLAENPEWRPIVGVVRALSFGAAVLATAYGVGRLDEVVPGLGDLYGGVDVGGILQRMVLIFDGAVVAALAWQLARVSWIAMRARPGRWQATDNAGSTAVQG